MPKSFTSKRLRKPAPTIDRTWDETRFVWMALRYKLLPWHRVSKRKLRNVYRRLLNYLAAIIDSSVMYYQYKEALDASWPEMREKLRKNPALAQFMLEYGVFSEFFYPFLLRIPQATTLDVAYGYGYDLLGRYRAIPPTDAMYAFCRGDEMFAWIRRRIEGEQRFLKRAKRVLFVGGGVLQALRRNDYPLGELEQEIVAYDLNTQLEQAMPEIFPRPLAEYGISYHYENAANVYADSQYQNYFDVVDVSGVLSYRATDQELKETLNNILSVVKPCGQIVFDLQVLTPTLLFDKMLGWKTNPAMKPERNTTAAVNKVRKICAELGVEVDILWAAAIGVQFVIRKRS